MTERLLRLWCRTMHGIHISRPMHNSYRCWRCLREYKVDWEPRAKFEVIEIPANRENKSVKSA